MDTKEAGAAHPGLPEIVLWARGPDAGVPPATRQSQFYLLSGGG